MEELLICPSCHAQNPANSYFCLNCGKKLRDKVLSVSASKQLLMYVVSALLPPFGLGWAYGYLRQGTGTTKKIGIAIIIITIVSLILNLWAIFALYGSYYRMLNQLTNVNY